MMADYNNKISTLLSEFTKCKNSDMDLNLKERSRTSLFPWRGQFSPQLIEILLNNFAKTNSIVLDPFVGSGTTLFESAGLSLECRSEDHVP